MQGRLVMRKLSVCPSVRQTRVHIYIPYERTFSLVFSEEEWLMGRPLLPEISCQPAPIGA